MWEDREDRLARGTLDAPDGHPAQTDAHIMRMAGQAPTSLTRRLVFELKAQGQEKSHHQFHKGLAVAQQLPAVSANNPPAHARKRAPKSSPEAALRAGEGVR